MTDCLKTKNANTINYFPFTSSPFCLFDMQLLFVAQKETWQYHMFTEKKMESKIFWKRQTAIQSREKTRGNLF